MLSDASGTEASVASFDAVSVDFSILNSWSTSYQGRFTVTNESAAPVSSWSVYITGSPLRMRDTWGSFQIEVTKIADGIYFIEGSGKTLQPGDRASVTFTGNGSAPDDVVILDEAPILEAPMDVPMPAPEPITDTARQTEPEAPVSAEFSILNSWSTSYQGRFTVTNEAAAPVSSWSIYIAGSPLKVRDTWGSFEIEVTRVADGIYLIEGSGKTLQPGDRASVTFTGNGSAPDDVVILDEAPVLGTPPDEPAPEPEPAPETEPEPVPAPEPVAVGAAVSAEVSIGAVWNGGYNGVIEVRNETSDVMERWSIAISSDTLVIHEAWGVRVATLGEGVFRLDGSGYAERLEPGQSLSVGFTGAGSPPDDLVILPSETDQAALQDSPFDGAAYAEALGLSMTFYFAQYSGDLADDHPVAWRGDSGLLDGADVGRDLSGGFYDAGDHVKFGLPQAYTATILAMGATEFETGYRAAGQYETIVAHVDWVTDYLLRCYDDRGTADLADDVFYAQVGDPMADHAYWGAAEDMTMDRPSYALTLDAPGTEVTAQTAAALASGGLLMRAAGDQERAGTLIEAAEALFAFSLASQGSYVDAIPGVERYYGSLGGYADEIAWAATWLHEATGDEAYLAVAEDHYQPSGTYWAMTWDDQSMATAMRLAEVTGDQRYLDDLDRHFDHWLYGVDRLEGTDSNEGLAWIEEWGSNRYAANTAFLALDYADFLDTRGEVDRAEQLTGFARDQIDYMLGDNPDRFSYVVGFGDAFARQPHHRGASGTDHVGIAGDNLHQLDGALVGGPDQFGTYIDDRTDYVGNEVAIDYNAGLSGALAALYDDALNFV